MTADAVAGALQSVQAVYQNLPHADLASDLAALSAQMVASGGYKTAVIVPGGISATLPDGSTALVFADRQEDLALPTTSQAPQSASRSRADLPLSSANQHEIAFFINEFDTSGAFDPARTATFANAFLQRGFTPANGYGIDDLDVTLDNLESLGTARPIDFVEISTHGMIAAHGKDASGNPFYDYAWMSTTPVSAANNLKYMAERAANSVFYAIYIDTKYKATTKLPQYAFTPQFVTTHLTFNDGAFLYNSSCFGASSLIDLAVRAELGAAGVGRYLAWTKSVVGSDSDETDAFIYDRLLGEQSPSVTGLDTLASQLATPQRPFPLDDVLGVVGTELRNSPIQPPKGYNYAISQGIAINRAYPPKGLAANLDITRFTNGAANPPIVYGLPSISQLRVAEALSGGTLTILGSFPPKAGTAQITDGGGTTKLTPTVWATDHITAALPASGPGSAGLVQVFDATGIASNAVPLTQWKGTLVATERDQIPVIDNIPGSGSGTIVTTYTIDFRSDVHPTAPSIDASPVPQNLYFSGVEGDSSGVFTTYTGNFISTDGSSTATFSLSPTAPTLPLFMPPLTGSSFTVAPESGQPASCNNGMPGPQMGSATVFCPAIGYVSQNVSVCSDNREHILCQFDTSPVSGFGLPQPGDGLLILTMDPATYAISVSSIPAATTSNNFAGMARPATGSITGSFAAAAYPPSTKTPALRSRRQ